MVLVLALSFFASAVYAILSYARLVLTEPEPFAFDVTVQFSPAEFDPWHLLNSIAGRLFDLVPVALVAHLLAREGGSMHEIGFDASRPWRDTRFGVGLAGVAILLVVGYVWAADVTGLPTRMILPVSPDAHVSVVPLLLLGSAVAAISEEVIVAGYLLLRLDQLGWGTRHALLASAVLRASYHIYQGLLWFLAMFLVGLVLGRIYQRTGRTMPLVVAHFAYDAVIFVGYLALVGRVEWIPT